MTWDAKTWFRWSISVSGFWDVYLCLSATERFVMQLSTDNLKAWALFIQFSYMESLIPGFISWQQAFYVNITDWLAPWSQDPMVHHHIYKSATSLMAKQATFLPLVLKTHEECLTDESSQKYFLGLHEVMTPLVAPQTRFLPKITRLNMLRMTYSKTSRRGIK
jgi:hypothetical protein